MNIINNIKAQYHDKFIADNLNKNNISQLKEYFKNINKKNSKEFIDIAKKYINQLHEHPDSDLFFDKSLIWLNSFDNSDISILKKFFNYYFSKTNKHNFIMQPYAKFLEELMHYYNQPVKNIYFRDLLSFSSLYQYLITLINPNKELYIENSAAFFEFKKSNYMINPRTTLCYIFIEQNPIHLYMRYKSLYGKDYALNEICNLDNSLGTFKTDHQFELQENKQNWAVNSKSWKDTNVLLTNKGMVVPIRDLIEDPMTVFANIVAHLKEASVIIEMSYEEIENFINENQNLFRPSPLPEISNNEKKILQREFGASGIDLEEFL